MHLQQIGNDATLAGTLTGQARRLNDVHPDEFFEQVALVSQYLSLDKVVVLEQSSLVEQRSTFEADVIDEMSDECIRPNVRRAPS